MDIGFLITALLSIKKDSFTPHCIMVWISHMFVQKLHIIKLFFTFDPQISAKALVNKSFQGLYEKC